MYYRKYLVINLIGNINYINKSAFEIHNIVIGNRFGSKIIENKDLLNELKRNVNRDVWINKCNNITIEKLQLTNYYLYTFFRRKNIFYYNLFITDNESNDIIYNSKNVYNVNNSFHIKEKQIKKILYDDYELYK
jgi:hypothetical protein